MRSLSSRLSRAQRQSVERLEVSSAHIFAELRNALEMKPHLLLAWEWCLYLALFNGGRYIRRILRGAGAEFWVGAGGAREEGELPLRFWGFDGGEDGEDVRGEFMRRFEEGSLLLSERERGEVVVEAGRVFEVCEMVVGVLDAFAEEVGRSGEVEGKEGMRKKVLLRRGGDVVAGGKRWRWRIGVGFCLLLVAATACWQYLFDACLSAQRLIVSGDRAEHGLRS